MRNLQSYLPGRTVPPAKLFLPLSDLIRAYLKYGSSDSLDVLRLGSQSMSGMLVQNGVQRFVSWGLRCYVTGLFSSLARLHRDWQASIKYHDQFR